MPRVSKKKLGFPDFRPHANESDGAVAKNLPANAGDARDVGLIPGLGKSPGEGKGNQFQFFLPGKFYGQRGLVGYSM